MVLGKEKGTYSQNLPYSEPLTKVAICRLSRSSFKNCGASGEWEWVEVKLIQKETEDQM